MNDIPRTLRISLRPCITFALTLSPLLVLALILLVRRGYQPAVLFLVAVPLVLYALIITIVVSQRVMVRPDGIEMTTLFCIKRFIPFSSITHTEVQCLAEHDHPIRALIHTTDRENPAIPIKLKALVREDAAWLCALPELKANPDTTFLK